MAAAMRGPGKYDAICTQAREAAGPEAEVLLIVRDGVHGNGFSVQASLETIVTLPSILRQIASAIEQTGENR